MLQMHQAPFPTCKCEFKLRHTRTQKLHQWSEVNDSPAFKCVDNGHGGRARQQSEASGVHPRTTLGRRGPSVDTSWPAHARRGDVRRTGGDGCSSLWLIHVTACADTPGQGVYRGRLRSRGQTEQASAGQLMPRERACRARLRG